MHTIWLYIVDSEYRAVTDARVKAVHDSDHAVTFTRQNERWVAERVPTGRVTVSVTAESHQPETHSFNTKDEVTQVVVGLRRAGQLSYSHGLDRLAFTPREDSSSFRSADRTPPRRWRRSRAS